MAGTGCIHTLTACGHVNACTQVAREDHFAAVKNAPGSATDSPDTARAAMLAQGARWVAAAGGQLAAGCEGVEVAPLVSYAGEGLQELVQGPTLQVCACMSYCKDWWVGGCRQGECTDR
jgi:UDP-N-acetylglucosamine/UDP-N-acetylgalactosamine diphosphorylase